MRDNSFNNPNKNKGFALLAAIFLIVILASVAALMANLLSLQSTSTVHSLLTTQAYHAANSGLAWSRAIIQSEGACPSAPAHPMTFSLNEGGFKNVNITITCLESANITEGANTFKRYDVTARAEIGSFGSTYYASRELEAILFN